MSPSVESILGHERKLYNCEVLEGLRDYARVPRLAACAEWRNPSNTSQLYSLELSFSSDI